MGRLTTHVLDTAVGKPAAGMVVELYRLDASGEQRLASARTNADGRLDAPVIEGAALSVGVYELRFHAGDYWRAAGRIAEPPFLDTVPVRFGIASPDAHYHVPLLLSPYGYSTYRGS
jgi:5-hydroxyisourate hydrolase